MLLIMDYLGENFPGTRKVISGGDQLTCERQSNAHRQMMDGDALKERLQLLEPVCKDWHTLMSFLEVRHQNCTLTCSVDSFLVFYSECVCVWCVYVLCGTSRSYGSGY